MIDIADLPSRIPHIVKVMPANDLAKILSAQRHLASIAAPMVVC